MNTNNSAHLNVVILGATGAVGTEVVKSLAEQDSIKKITIIGRREFTKVTHNKITQHIVDIQDPQSYKPYIDDADAAICTLGVGQPSKISRDDFLKIDRDVPLQFGKACKDAGVLHFSLLSSIGVSSDSSSFFLKSKGQLEDGLRALQFERLSLFHPSMILTPTNRYGFSQALTLLIWPLLNPVLLGPLKKARSIKVETLGQAFAKNVLIDRKNIEVLTWYDFMNITQK